MKRKKIDSFTLFVILLLALILTLLGMLLADMKEEKTAILLYCSHLEIWLMMKIFLQKAKKIKRYKKKSGQS
mgnify:CR=1 FL=1